MSKKQTRSREFTAKARKEIKERDRGECIFCQIGYHTEGATWCDKETKSIMHYIPRSDNGLGIPQNAAVGCQWHHDMLDNGSKGRRREMLEIFADYLRSCYPDWDKINLRYSKWDFLKETQNG